MEENKYRAFLCGFGLNDKEIDRQVAKPEKQQQDLGAEILKYVRDMHNLFLKYNLPELQRDGKISAGEREAVEKAVNRWQINQTGEVRE